MDCKPDTFVEVRNIDKSFPGVKALSDVSFSVRRGEVHAICGENGAGKSTLIKILTGAYQKDAGQIFVEGEEVEITSTHRAMELGIACIYQELSLVPLLDLAKNLFLGNIPLTKQGLVDNRTLYQKAQEILDRIGLKVPARTPVNEISIAQQQMVEIGRALTRNAKLIIMDEPTSSLTDKEVTVLFELIERLRDEGVSIVYISHKLEEVLRISDRITILRDGQSITTFETAGVSREQLISAMIGRTLDNLYNKMKVEQGEVALTVEGLTKEGVFQDISFEVRRGEVLGFFGLVGAGRTEIMQSIFGIDRYDSGHILIDGEEVQIRSPKHAVEKGLALVPEDRRVSGLALRLNVLSNMTIVKLRQISRAGVIQKKERLRLAQQYIDSIHIKTPSMYQVVQNLSGGNQQKVVIAKWLMMHPKVLILDEPTRGVDVGAKSEIYGLISELASKGVAVIVVSSEIPEILGTCDRVATIYEGRLTSIMNVADATSDKILSAALGGVGA